MYVNALTKMSICPIIILRVVFTSPNIRLIIFYSSKVQMSIPDCSQRLQRCVSVVCSRGGLSLGLEVLGSVFVHSGLFWSALHFPLQRSGVYSTPHTSTRYFLECTPLHPTNYWSEFYSIMHCECLSPLLCSIQLGIGLFLNCQLP